MKLLWIGNSYIQRNDLPALVAQMAKAQNHKMEHERFVINGASLRRHWNSGLALEAIRRGGWDAVVLQEQSTLPVKNAARFHQNVRLFAPEIAAAGARLLLFGTWARQDRPETQALLDEAIADIAHEIGASVAPVGAAWARALRENPELSLYEADGSHPTLLGSYAAACVFLEVLLRCPPSPETALHVAPEIEPSAARILQLAAQQALAHLQ